MAIQVSGTEVISNARALTNIASVDATTVASMSAAGVGGNTVKLVDNVAITNTPSAIEVSFSATYLIYRIVISYARSSLNADQYGNSFGLRARLRDSSNNVISSNTYYNRFSGSNSLNLKTYMNISSSGLTTSTNSFVSSTIDVYTPYQSTNTTQVVASTFGRDTQYNDNFSNDLHVHRYEAPTQFNGLSIVLSAGDLYAISPWANIGTRYSVWGIK